MSCNNPDDRFFNQQEHRQISRLWERAVQKQSTSRVDLNQSGNLTGQDGQDGSRSGPHFGRQGINENSSQGPLEADSMKIKLPSEAVQKKLAKGKSVPKRKSPLQKFDEIVTRVLTNLRVSEESGMSTFEGSKNWSTLKFSRSKLSVFGVSKISVDNKVSRSALHSIEKDVRDGDPLDCQDPALMDAIEKLAQAQAYCRFNAAVQAAEAATASVPPERAEEVAVALAKDYQSEIVDVINEKMPSSDEKKPMEVIGYIGVTKLKNT